MSKTNLSGSFKTSFEGGNTFNYFDNNSQFAETSPDFNKRSDDGSFKVIKGIASSTQVPSSKPISDAVYNPLPPEFPKSSQSERSPRLSQKLSTSSRSSSNTNLTQTLFSTQKTAKSLTLKDKAMRMDPIYDLTDSQYEKLLGELVEERRNLATSYRFKESAHVTDAIRHVEACQIKQQKYELQVEAVQQFDEQVADFQSRLAEFDKETERLEVELRGRLAEQRKRILLLHQKELDKHIKKWSAESMKRQYNHASFKLRGLQKQFRLLMLECRFNEAEDIKATIDRMVEREQQDAIKQMQHDFEESTNKLKAKLDVEMTSYEERGQVQIKQLKQKREWLRLSFLNKERKFEQKAAQISDQEKLWNVHQLQRKDELAKGKKLSTPNTANRLNEEDVRDREMPTIQLPPLRITDDFSKTTR